MAIRLKRDADDKWFYGNDWTDYLAEIVEKTGGTATITASVWTFSDATIVEETETPSDDDGGVTYLVASGGTNGTKFDATNKITLTVTSTNSTLNVTDLTQSRTVSIVLEDL